MSWLEEIQRVWLFKCGICKHITEVIMDDRLDRDELATKGICSCCKSQGSFKYSGFRNLEEIPLTKNISRKTYEQNGRKAVKIGDTYMSKSKLNYLETGKIEQFNTSQYEEDSAKKELKLKNDLDKIVKSGVIK